MARVLWLALLVLAALSAASVRAQGEGASLDTYGPWINGRATYYGGPTENWVLLNGGCNYGYIDPREPLGWQITAMSDVDGLYTRGVCGFCLEVRCAPSTFSDNYGAVLDRRSACYNTSRSMVVRITDTCPCTFAPNAYSNKRWCCGDMPHLDLSYIAFIALAEERWGVIGLQYRQVPCSHKPTVPAIPADYTRFDTRYNPTAPLPLRGWPEYSRGAPPTALAWSNQGYGPGWVEASWKSNVLPWAQTATAGMGGTPAYCGSVGVTGAMALFSTNPNMFVGRTRLSFWMYVGVTGYNGLEAKVADITLQLSGTQGDCSIVRIWAVRPQLFAPRCTYCTDYWWRWEFFLGGFNGGDPNTPMRPGTFTGCGGNSPRELNKISFRNDGYGGWDYKYFCLDGIQLS